ncbi:basic helix-loop-helix ARNT-like protein 2 isoform X2 [Ahaetulla prasina]|uniref:basic helix-loop-helix ARNT-like protein 2 isoform X2 n=1 Tax=Ahaetulla prasina TaxID=499056 RepID=UPI0026485A58|nr:basic helix-loop-helix ARNT-like protein 2 isoform X2 [Ahaetulla prasina]
MGKELKGRKKGREGKESGKERKGGGERREEKRRAVGRSGKEAHPPTPPPGARLGNAEGQRPAGGRGGGIQAGSPAAHLGSKAQVGQRRAEPPWGGKEGPCLCTPPPPPSPSKASRAQRSSGGGAGTAAASGAGAGRAEPWWPLQPEEKEEEEEEEEGEREPPACLTPSMPRGPPSAGEPRPWRRRPARAQVRARGAPDNHPREANQAVVLAGSNTMSPVAPSINSFTAEFPRKRKGSDSDTQYTCDTEGDDLHSRSEDEEHVKIKYFREAHSQTEKKRRDKMNNLIEELSTMIPQCSPVARKLDKLTVLRMAVQHFKSMKGSPGPYSEIRYKPSFLQDDELQHLILKVADGFLFVVGCDRGRILFVSESVSKILNYDPAHLTGQSLFDYLHPKDVAKIKEQLSSSDASAREKLIDTKNHKKYCTIHCTGYLKIWSTNEVGIEGDTEKEGGHFNCLVAVGRLHPYTIPQKSFEIKVKSTEFVTRFAVDGKFVFVDQRATTILGYLPQELLGTSCYEYFHQNDHNHLTEKHKTVLQSKEKIFTNFYKFKAKDSSFVTLKSQWFSFTNPWTKELEYIVSINTVVLGHNESGEETLLGCSSLSPEDVTKPQVLDVPGMSTETILGAGSIGTKIANEVLDLQRLPASPLGELSPSDLLRKSSSGLPVTCDEAPDKVLKVLSSSSLEDLETPEQTPDVISFSNNEPLLSGPSQLDFEKETGMTDLMNYLEAEGGLAESTELSDMQWAL